MSARDLPSAIPADMGEAVLALSRRITELEAEVKALQAERGRWLPGDYRFVMGTFGDIYIRRVSSQNAQAVTGPL